MSLHRTQIGKHAHRRAHGQQALLRPDLCVGVAPLRPADGAQQYGVRFSAQLARSFREGIAAVIDGDTADQRLTEGEAMLVLRSQ